jgi:ABC-2 type transport system permease protein
VSDVSIAVAEFTYDQKSFWRSPMSLFATVSLPLLYLFIFVTNFGDELTTVPGQPGTMEVSTYLVATIVAIGIVSATFFDLAVALVQERERGILKRLRSTPVPTWAFIAGRVGNAIVVSVLLTALLVALGRLVYGVGVPTERLPALVLALVAGSVCFCCCGFAFTIAVPKENAALALAMGTMLTLFFISGNFFEVESSAMRSVGEVFPVTHLNSALLTAFNPNTTGSGIRLSDIAVMALWGVGGLALASRFFRWTPSAG